MSSNLSSARRVKSSQGSRRGTCGWITSFFSFLLSSESQKEEKTKNLQETVKRNLHFFYFPFCPWKGNHHCQLYFHSIIEETSVMSIHWARSSAVERLPCKEEASGSKTEWPTGFRRKSRRVHYNHGKTLINPAPCFCEAKVRKVVTRWGGTPLRAAGEHDNKANPITKPPLTKISTENDKKIKQKQSITTK